MSMAAITFTFILTISNSLCSFPICGKQWKPPSLSMTRRRLAVLISAHRTHADDQRPLQKVTFPNIQRFTSAYVQLFYRLDPAAPRIDLASLIRDPRLRKFTDEETK